MNGLTVKQQRNSALYLNCNRPIEMGDILQIYPFSGKYKELTLNRTRYHLKGMSIDNNLYQGTDIALKTIKNEDFALCFELLNFYDEREQSEKTIYKVISENDCPFLFNGSLVVQAFLQHGDIIGLGPIRLSFKAKDHCIDKIEFNDEKISFLNNMRFLNSNMALLIEGETGTGKGFLAKEVHRRSVVSGHRADQFVHINLSSFSPTLIESELFGHVQGAFTGAGKSKLGALREAEYGTLFLDEMDSLSLDLQTKLLLFLDDYKVRAVGDDKSKKIDVKIIFASRRNLIEMVKAGQFREDLYYRMTSGPTIKLLPLREDTSRIFEIIRSFSMKNDLSFSQDLVEYYQTLLWPGNVRQLISHLEKKMLTMNGRKLVIDDSDKNLVTINSMIVSKNDGVFSSLENVKKEYALYVYHILNKNIQQTCSVLDISINTLKSYVGFKK